MDLSYGAENERFRLEVREFLAEGWKPPAVRGAELRAYIDDFRQRGVTKGYLYRTIPKRFGGSEQPVDVVKAQVIREEFGRARAPMEVTGNGMNMLVPTLLDRGTDAQREFFIRPTMAGKFIWGQGYSEPGTGSDLASVRTKGELINGEWVINGQKIWTSQGQQANYMFALIRTEPGAPKHEGMKTPAEWIVGERGEGWNGSRTTLKHERASIGSADGLGAQFRKLVELAQTTPRNGKPAIQDPLIREALVKIEGWVLAHRCSSYRIFSLAAAREEPGIISLMMKLLLTETGHEIALLAQELIGDFALLEASQTETRGRGPEKWLDQIMGSLGNSIAGGTTNIQRNIIGERGLGLPRDLAMGDK